MVTYHFTSGRVVRLHAREGNHEDPSAVSVILECEESIQFGNFVYDAAIRWKLGETALFNELLALLLAELVRRGRAGGGEGEEEEEKLCEVSDNERLSPAPGQEGSPVKLELAVKFETPGLFGNSS